MCQPHKARIEGDADHDADSSAASDLSSPAPHSRRRTSSSTHQQSRQHHRHHQHGSSGTASGTSNAHVTRAYPHHALLLIPTFSESQLRLAAVLSHPPTGRCLRVSTDSAGVQVYSANFLDGTNPLPSLCKEGASYKQWQGLCLETQAYPNSIFFGKEEDVPEEEKEFARGRCFILRPGQEEYRHRVQYEFSAI